MPNPFFEDWQTPFGLPPFAAIADAHYMEAFDQGFVEHAAEIAAICANPEPASFSNTIEALERAGALLKKVNGVFFNLTSAAANDALQEIELAVVPRFAVHDSAMLTNQTLFTRIKAVQASASGLQEDQQRLLQDTFERFVRAGAALDAAGRAEAQTLDEALASLTTRFSQNVMKDTDNYMLVLENADELAGLPASVLQAAQEEAATRGLAGKYGFTTSRSSITPFLQFAERRDLREQLYKAYTQRGSNGNAFDNRQLLTEIAAKRARRAQLLGYANHADYMLADRMAGTADAVMNLLDQVWTPASQRVRQEAQDLQACIQAAGDNFALAPWDWDYYTEKVRQTRFDLDDAEVKPYFELENVRDGMFRVATRLFGITFHRLEDVPRYHSDVVTFEVREADGTLVGVFMTDYFMRAGKQGGAWMSAYRTQSNLDGIVRPVIVNCCNFPKGSPTLLGMDEVRTLFHEFGHGLHGLLSQVRYASQAGTNVLQDFVELPSQIMEHWAEQPEVLRDYARHVETGEIMPDALMEKLLAAATFNQGFATTEYLAAAYLDMAWHQLESGQIGDADAGVSSVATLEADAMSQIDLLAEVDPRYRSSYFQHIFGGESYSAGYYAYLWAEVLDADGFEAFKEAGIFDPATANSFRKNILEQGGSAEPMALYQRFRGRAPKVAPLLKSRGLV